MKIPAEVSGSHLLLSCARYSVRAFGAKGDGVHDDTAAIQTAINTCDANGGGTVSFPNGIYRIDGPLQPEHNNCQIYVPDRLPDDPQRGSIMLRGETRANLYAGGCAGQLRPNGVAETSGVILRSTIVGTGSRPSVISGKSAAIQKWGNFIYRNVHVENMTIQVDAGLLAGGPTLTAINGEHFSSLTVRHVTLCQQVETFKTAFPENEAAGIVIGLTNCDFPQQLEGVSVSGFKYGVVCGEHVTVNNLSAFACRYGFVPLFNGYPINVGYMVLHWNVHHVYLPAETILHGLPPGDCYLNVNMACIEGYAGEYWYATKHFILDEKDFARGRMGYVATQEYPVIGASRLSRTHLNRLPGHGNEWDNTSRIPFQRAKGAFGFNTETNRMEYWNGTTWMQL